MHNVHCFRESEKNFYENLEVAGINSLKPEEYHKIGGYALLCTTWCHLHDLYETPPGFPWASWQPR